MANLLRQAQAISSTMFVQFTEDSDNDQLPRQKAERDAREAVAEMAKGTGLIKVGSVGSEVSTAEVIPLPHFRVRKSQEKVFSAAKEWEGVITFISGEAIVAELRNIASADDETDTMEIPITDVPRADRHLLREGAIFRYLVGYAKNHGGTLSTKRHVYIRRGKQKSTPASLEEHWVSLLEKLGE